MLVFPLDSYEILIVTLYSLAAFVHGRFAYWVLYVCSNNYTIGAVCIIVNEPVKDLNFWRVAFGLIAIVFNPIIPVYLHDKAIWMPIDIIAAILFTIKLSILKSTKHE